MSDYVRFLFESMSLVNQAPIAQTFPPPRKNHALPPMIRMGGAQHYMATASAFRGGIRRYMAHNVLWRLREYNAEAKFDSDTLRLTTIGGVKGSGSTNYISPAALNKVREMNPLLDMVGAGDPIFIGGALLAGLIVSLEPVVFDRTQIGSPVRIPPDTTIPIVRRTVMSDTVFQPSDISDQEALVEAAEANRVRSQLERATKEWEDAARREQRAPSARNKRTIANSIETLEALTGTLTQTPILFKDVDEAKAWVEAHKSGMEARGQSTVSEGQIQYIAIIPALTEFRHRLEIRYASQAAVGLFLHGWHDKYRLNPTFGGLAARGCGGYFESTYLVQRQVGDGELEYDCAITIKPNIGLQFQKADKSLLYAAYQTWHDTDVRQFNFNFGALQRFVRGDDQ